MFAAGAPCGFTIIMFLQNLVFLFFPLLALTLLIASIFQFRLASRQLAAAEEDFEQALLKAKTHD